MSGRVEVIWSLTSHYKALHDDGSECYGAVVIYLSSLCFLGNRNNGGHLEACGNSRLDMSINTPASWSAHALSMQLGMPSGPAALRGLTRLNVLLTLAAVKVSPQVLVAGRVSGTELSSKRAKKLFSLSGSKTSCSAMGQIFILWSVIDCRPCYVPLVSEPLICDSTLSLY